MAFRATIKVCFSDIDNAGIVYYPRFIHYFHLAMEEFFRNVMEIDFSAVLHERNVACPTVHLECDFMTAFEIRGHNRDGGHDPQYRPELDHLGIQGYFPAKRILLWRGIMSRSASRGIHLKRLMSLNG